MMETNAERDHARELFARHHARYEVSPYFVLLDVRTVGVAPSHRRIHAGFDVDVYGNGFDHGSAETLQELVGACHVVVEQAARDSRVEVIPDEGTLVFNVKSHLEPEALVRIRITHSRGLDQPAGASEEKALAGVLDGLESLGVRKSVFAGS